MNRRIRSAACVVSALMTFGIGVGAHAQADPPTTPSIHKGAAMPLHASGTFDVKMSPLVAYNTQEGAGLGRMSIDKQFHGALAASSKGEMLTASGGVKGSAAYVAVERVSGTLGGRSGSFALQHTGIMDRGAPQLTISVVPDSGTEQLQGLSGTMGITIADGQHSYDFEYTLP